MAPTEVYVLLEHGQPAGFTLSEVEAVAWFEEAPLNRDYRLLRPIEGTTTWGS
jgi:hypothetical protein